LSAPGPVFVVAAPSAGAADAAFGHSVFEQVYRIDDRRQAVLRKLAPRPAQTIAYWDVARDGGLNGIQQYPEGSDRRRRPGHLRRAARSTT
jgi:hypothetical protein